MPKYVIGRLRLKPGTRDEYVELHREYLDKARQEAGLLYYEEGRATDDPDLLILVECWETAAAHQAHVTQPHYAAFAEVFKKYARHAIFRRSTPVRFTTSLPT